MPPAFLNETQFRSFAGECLQWFFMEIVLFMFFIITMMLLMMKSRFFTVGTDNSHQFEPPYMKKMADLIIRHIDFDFAERIRTREKTRKYFVGK